MTLKVNGKVLPTIAIGTWAWGTGINGSQMVFGQKTDKAQIASAFDKAVTAGFNFWDTAPVYGMGNSEKILGEFAEHQPIIFSTKYAPTGKDSLQKVRKSYEGSIQRLKIDKPDIFWIHTARNWQETLSHFIVLLKEDKIGSIGVSNFTMEQIQEVERILQKEGFHLGGVQNHYSLLRRYSEKTGIIDWCQKNNIPFFAYMVLEQGALTGRYDSTHPFPRFSRRGAAYNKKTLKKIEPLHQALAEVGANYQISIAQTAMAWAITKETLPLIGITKSHQVDELLKVSSLKLSLEEVRKLDEVAEKTELEISGSWEKAN